MMADAIEGRLDMEMTEEGLEKGSSGFGRRVGTVGQAWLIFSLVFSSLSFGEHTEATKSGEIYGLPPWCCDMRDCQAADVRLLRMEGKMPIVLVDGKVYRVVGSDGDGRKGLFIAPGKQTYWCPLRGDTVRCVLLRPGGEI